MPPKIKDSISVLYRKRGEMYEVNFLLNASSTVLPFELNESAFQCLKYMDGQHTIEQIAENTGVSYQEVTQLTTALRKARLLSTSNRTNYTQGTRFATQLNFFAEFETPSLTREDMQDKLRQSRVMIIGLGGIGSWMVQGLALAGVRSFTLVDPDIVELSNLNRQCLFALQDIGKPKGEVIAEKLRLIDNTITCIIHRMKILDRGTCKQAADNANLVINCADEPQTETVNRIVTEACYPLSLPHVLCGGYDGHLSFLGPTIIPGKSACWYCYEHALEKQIKLADYDHLQITPSHIQGGNIGAISAITANYHVLEAIKVLTGFATPTMLNRAAELDFLTFRIHFREYKKFRGCPICGKPRRKKHDEA